MPPSHEVLRRPAQQVTEEFIASGGVRRVIAKMRDARIAGQKKRQMVGIAAPQIGIPLRIVGVNVAYGTDTDRGQLRWLINPTYEPLDPDDMYYESEGCFSCLKIAGPVRRLKAISLDAQNLRRPMILEDTPGKRAHIRARIAQHEIDHLDGTTIARKIITDMSADLLPPASLVWVHTERRSKYADYLELVRSGKMTEPWHDWMPPEQWEAIESGLLVPPS